MLNIHNLTVSFQGDDLFSGITFQLRAGDRVGLVGKNGAGKSTLLKILSGEQEYDSGQIASDKKVSIGFLKQDIDFVKGRTVLEESYEAFKEIKKLENQLEKINQKLIERRSLNGQFIRTGCKQSHSNWLLRKRCGRTTPEKHLSSISALITAYDFHIRKLQVSGKSSRNQPQHVFHIYKVQHITYNCWLATGFWNSLHPAHSLFR